MSAFSIVVKFYVNCPRSVAIWLSKPIYPGWFVMLSYRGRLALDIGTQIIKAVMWEEMRSYGQDADGKIAKFLFQALRKEMATINNKPEMAFCELWQ